MKLKKKKHTLYTPGEVTQEESEHTQAVQCGGGRLVRGVLPRLSCCHYVVLIIKPSAQGAPVPGLLGACLPPACLTSTKAAPMGHDENTELGSPGRATQPCLELCGSPSLQGMS